MTNVYCHNGYSIPVSVASKKSSAAALGEQVFLFRGVMFAAAVLVAFLCQ